MSTAETVFADSPDPQSSPAVVQTEDGGVQFLRVEFPLPLPCGYVDPNGQLHADVEMVPMTGVEEDLLADEHKSKNMQFVNDMIANCLVRVGSIEAPYERTAKQRKMMLDAVGGMTISDRAFLIMILRRISFEDGDSYQFLELCPNKLCGKEFRPKLDLSTLTVYPMKDPKVRVGEIRLPRSQQVVRFRQLLVTDEPRLADAYRRWPSAKPSVTLFHKIVSVDGARVASPLDVQKLPTADRDALRRAMDDMDGGVDMEIIHTCPRCDHKYKGEFKVDLSFFQPSSLATRQT